MEGLRRRQLMAVRVGTGRRLCVQRSVQQRDPLRDERVDLVLAPQDAVEPARGLLGRAERRGGADSRGAGERQIGERRLGIRLPRPLASPPAGRGRSSQRRDDEDALAPLLASLAR